MPKISAGGVSASLLCVQPPGLRLGVCKPSFILPSPPGTAAIAGFGAGSGMSQTSSIAAKASAPGKEYLDHLPQHLGQIEVLVVCSRVMSSSGYLPAGDARSWLPNHREETESCASII